MGRCEHQSAPFPGVRDRRVETIATVERRDERPPGKSLPMPTLHCGSLRNIGCPDPTGRSAGTGAEIAAGFVAL
jgi:hypothetical protein